MFGVVEGQLMQIEEGIGVPVKAQVLTREMRVNFYELMPGTSLFIPYSEMTIEEARYELKVYCKRKTTKIKLKNLKCRFVSRTVYEGNKKIGLRVWLVKDGDRETV
jgi:hypothetical protein